MLDELSIGTLFTVLLPLLLVGETIVGLLLWRVSGHPMPDPLRRPLTAGGTRGGGEIRTVATWLAASVATLWVGFLVAFVGVHVLLFTIGREAALVGLIVSIVVLGAVPIVWAVVLHRRSRG